MRTFDYLRFFKTIKVTTAAAPITATTTLTAITISFISELFLLESFALNFFRFMPVLSA